MLQLLYRDYRLGNQDRIRKAVIISFSGQVEESNFLKHSRELKELIKKDFDSYIFYIRKPGELYAYTIRLMLAFSNSHKGKTGLLMKKNGDRTLDSLKMDNFFIIHHDIKTIIMQLEKAGGK